MGVYADAELCAAAGIDPSRRNEMIKPASLAFVRFGFHGGGGLAFLLLVAVGVGVFVWALTRSGRNSA
jgi:hypothetical protein